MGTYGPRIVAGIVALGLTVSAFMFLGPHAPPAVRRYEIIYFHPHMSRNCASQTLPNGACGF